MMETIKNRIQTIEAEIKMEREIQFKSITEQFKREARIRRQRLEAKLEEAKYILRLVEDNECIQVDSQTCIIK